MCDDFPIMATDIIRTARKDHKCCECGEVIKSGQQYWFHNSLYDGQWGAYKQCLRCRELMTKVEAAWHPDCVHFTELRESYLELWTEDDFGGLVPESWVKKARETIEYRKKYYA